MRKSKPTIIFSCTLILSLCAYTSSASQGNGTASPSAGKIGVPWQGETGISETVGEIIKREHARELLHLPKVHRIIPLKTNPNRKYNSQNPASPETSKWPVSSVSRIQSSISRPGPFTPQTLGTNFLGATLADASGFPPDSMGAAGPTQYIVAINGRIRSFNKTIGLADNVLNVDTDVFFASVMTPGYPVPSQNFTTDPRIRYDRLSDRWFITMLDVPGGATALPNRIMVAVSSGSTITSSSNFTFFQFRHDQVGTTPNIDTDNFADYDTLGIDANALYIGVNIFDPLGSFVSTTGFVVRKNSILGTGPIVVTAFRELVSTVTSEGPFTPQGVDNFDPAATEGYFIGISYLYFGELILRKVSNPGATPSISDNIIVTVPDTYLPLPVPQLGSSSDLDGIDDRLFAAQYRIINEVGSLWTAHNIAVDSTGVATSDLLTGRNGSRWYELRDIDTTPSLFQSGTIFDSADTNPRFYWIPSIMVSGQGHAALGFSTAGADEHANAATVGRLADDALGTTQTPELYTNSSTVYNPNDQSSPHRWGDYSYTSLDPSDDMTMWTIQEFCNAKNSYGVQVVKLLAPPPATPLSASPAIIPAGFLSVDLTITGENTTVPGSGFFDPGTGSANWSPNHISASISGITVNSVTYTDPLHASVNVSTVGSAPGSYNVTITNPDGQSATGTSILTICSPPAISPATILSGTKGTAYSQTFTSSGGAGGPYTLGITGILPTGITFSGGSISGTPTVTGGFPFTITATDSAGCTGSQDYTLRISEAEGVITDVRIDGATPAYYDTVQGALDAAIGNDIVQMRAVDFSETLLYDVLAAVRLSGGYNSDYSGNTGTPQPYTTITGSLTVLSGTLTVEYIIIH